MHEAIPERAVIAIPILIEMLADPALLVLSPVADIQFPPKVVHLALALPVAVHELPLVAVSIGILHRAEALEPAVPGAADDAHPVLQLHLLQGAGGVRLAAAPL
jgi:hypothetical protein